MLPCKRAPIKFQSNGSQQAIHTVFVYAEYDASKTMHATRYVICQLEVGVIACEKLYAFYAQNQARTTGFHVTILMYEMHKDENYQVGTLEMLELQNHRDIWTKEYNYCNHNERLSKSDTNLIKISTIYFI